LNSINAGQPASVPLFALLSRADLRLALAAPQPCDGWVSRWTDAAGLRTHHRAPERPVRGTPVVLLHGLAVSHRYLMPTARGLATRHPVLVPDLPGFGLSGKPAAAYDVEQHAGHVAAWLEALDLARVAVLGHSFGAQVAVALARRRPDAVAALVLAGPTVDPAAPTVGGQLRRWAVDLLFEDPRQAAVLARDVRDAGPRRILATLGHSVRHRIDEDLAGVGAPVLVIGGARDPVAPGRWRARLGGGRQVAVPGAGHNAATTAGGRVAEAVARFLAVSAAAERV
jgi:pimeloyl-ACP methyl ester carboxylesterase